MLRMQKRIIFRLPDQMYEQINALTKEGKFKNLSEIVRQALTEFLAKNKPLDDLLREAFSTTEGIDAWRRSAGLTLKRRTVLFIAANLSNGLV